MEELYDDGRDDLDEDRYDNAAAKFHELAEMNGPQTDAALYWKAYAENRLGKRDSSLTTIAELKRRFTKSRWLRDAGIRVRFVLAGEHWTKNQSRSRE